MNKKNEIIACEIETLITQFEEKKNAYHEEKLIQLLKENEIINFDKLSITECHVISCISTLKEANGISIAENLRMTRGGISKIATRLIEKGLITTYKDETNQKKIFYILTPLGEKINLIHEQLHRENHNSLCSIANNYTLQEQEIIIRFIKELQNNNIEKTYKGE